MPPASPRALSASPATAGRSTRRKASLARAVAAAVEPLEDRRLLSATLVSVGLSGAAANGRSGESSVSSDGRYVVFSSDASNLVTTDTNGFTDIFLRDTVSNTTRLISTGVSSAQGNSRSYAPKISADGRYVAFTSDATNLVSSDTNGVSDVFRFDTQTNTTVRVSVDAGGADANGQSRDPSISSDGRYIAFASFGSDITANDANNHNDVFIRDMNTGTTVLVSGTNGTTTASNGISFAPAISNDGRYVSFRSDGTNLTSGDTNGKEDVFLRDTQTNATTLVSVNTAGVSGNGASTASSISTDGRYVLFRSAASDLVSNDTNGQDDVFIRDTQTSTTSLLSINQSRTSSGAGLSEYPSLDASARFAAFSSKAPNLVAGDTGSHEDVFLRDLVAGPVYQLTVTAAGAAANGNSFDPYVSQDGMYVVFSSDASDLTSSDTNNRTDVFIASTSTPTTTTDTTPPTATISTTNPGPTTDNASFDFNVNLADNVGLDTVHLGSLNVTGPNSFTGAATLVSVVGSGTSAVATYRITAPGGALDLADDGTYTVTVQANAIKDAAGNAIAANTTIGTFAIDTNGDNNGGSGGGGGGGTVIPGLTAAVVSVTPSGVVGGTKGKAVVRLTNTTSAIITGPALVAVSASDNTTLDALDTMLKSVTKKLKLKPGKSINVKLPFVYPTSVGNGNYYLIGSANSSTSGAGASANAVTITQPFNDLTAAVANFTGSYSAGGKATAAVTITNGGNVKLNAPVEIQLASGSDGSGSSAEAVTSVTKKLMIAPGKSKVVKIKFAFPSTGLTAGTRFLTVVLDPSNTVAESDDTNNMAVSSGSFTLA